MGNYSSLWMQTGWNQFKDPEGHPKLHMPSVYEPLYGFPKGRKKREMLASEEDMNRYCVPVWQRDYCAHLAVDFYKCQKEYFPWASTYCTDQKHAWEICQRDDQILRMKEYERERRLLQKERRLKKQQAAGEKEGNGGETKKKE